MVRGNITKEPKKPDWVKEQKIIYNFWNAKLMAYLIPTIGDKPKIPYYARLHRSYQNEAGEWQDESVNIRRVEDWEEIKKAFEQDFAKYLKWISKKEALKKIEEKPTKKTVKEIMDKKPSIILDFLDETKVSEMDIKTTQELVRILFTKKNDIIDRYFSIFLDLLKIKKKDERHLEELNNIINRISLYGITASINHIMYRLRKIDMFEKMILDNETYERKGDESIHRLLEKDIWLLGEEYQVLQSDKSLRTLIGEYFIKKYKKYGRLRPDFACSTFKNKQLIIVEIKRPTYKMIIDDINKVELYRNIAERYASENFTESECYLIVNSIPRDLRKTVRDRKLNKIYVKTYREVIDDVKIRYQRLLQILKEDIKKLEKEA